MREHIRATIVAVVSACGGGEEPVLSSGNYVVSEARHVENACGLLPPVGEWNGRVLDVKHTGDASGGTIGVKIGGLGRDTNGTIEDGTVETSVAWRRDYSTESSPRDCVLDLSQRYRGDVISANEADLTFEPSIEVFSGSECGLVAADLAADVGTAVAFPCHARGAIHLTRGPSEWIGSATIVGSDSPLTVNGSGVPGISTMTVSGDIMGEPFSGTSRWMCYAPFSLSPDAYELTNKPEGNVPVTIHVPTAQWTVGSHPISRTGPVNVGLELSAGRFGYLTGGTLVLMSAPTVMDAPCSFSITGASLEVVLGP